MLLFRVIVFDFLEIDTEESGVGKKKRIKFDMDGVSPWMEI